MDARPDDAKHFPEVFHAELGQIDKRRGQSGHGANAGPATEEEVRRRAMEKELVGLAFSGGGIRSATFNLGILQTLAEFKLLKHIDYLSTVSGGGYIGSWLAAWIQRDGSIENVQTLLKPTRADQAQATRTAVHETPDGVEAAPVAKGTVFATEPQPIVHLRAFSNYLSPRLGIFSADVWVLGAIYLRNLLLNQAAIAPAILAVIFLARLMYWAFLRENQALWKEHATGAMAGVVALSVLALVWIIYSLWRLDEIHQERGTRKIVMQLGTGPLHLFVLLPLVISACLVCRILVSEGVHFWSAFWNVIWTTFRVVLDAADFGRLSAPWLGLLTCIAVGMGAGLLILRCVSLPGRRKLAIALAISGGLIVTALLIWFSLWQQESRGWETPWRRSVASGVLVGALFFTVVLVLQVIWFARFVWLAFGWRRDTSGWAFLGFAGWLLASFFVGLVGGFVVSVPVFFLGHLLDQNSAWAIYLWCGALLAAPHVLGYLLCLLLGARVKSPGNLERHQGRTTDIPRAILEPAAPGRIRELFTAASPGALLVWAVLGVATGVGSLVLLFTLHSLGLLLLDRLTAEYPYWRHAVGWGLTIGCLLGWAHLYYLLILLVRFGHAGWEKSGDARAEPIANEKRWSRFLRHLQLKDSGPGLVISLGVGIFVSGALWAVFGEEPISALLGLPDGAGLFVPPAASVALFLLWQCPGLRRAPIWLGAGLASGLLGGVLLYILADLIDPNAGRSMSLAVAAAGALGSLGLPAEVAALATASALVSNWPPDPFALALTVVFGPPAVLAIVGLMIALEVGLLSRMMAESVREWLGSLAGWLLIYSTWYVIVFGVALFGGWLLNETGPVLNTVLGAGWLTTALTGVLAGHSARTGADGDSTRLEIIARGAPYVFLLGLLFLLAWLVGFLVNDPPDESFGRQQVPLVTTPTAPPTKVAQINKTHSENGASAQQTEDHVRTREQMEEQPEASIRRAIFWEGMRRAKMTTLLGWLFGFLALAALMAWRIDVNLFSLSALYGNRLIRCYLGASRARPPSADPLAVGAPIDNPITEVALHPGAVGAPRIDGPIQGPATLAGGGELSVGAPCYYVITALTPKGETAPSNEQTVTPSLVQRTAQLSWNVHPQAVGYRIYRSQTPGMYASPALLASIKDGHVTSYVDAGADVADAALPQSTGFVGRPTDPVRQPNPITGLDDQDDMPLRQLVIERPAGPVQNEATLGAGGALAVDVPYCYVITAVTAAGETAHSKEQNIKPTGGPAPRRTARLSWQPHAGASEYRIYRSLKSGQYASPALLATIRKSDVTTYVDAGADVSPYDDRQYTGPYVLINAALNLVHAENLAWQERKAESFVFTPLFCGSEGTGFQPLVFKHDDGFLAEKIQRRRDRLTLGNAVTTSGAAASPNMGYHSSPAVTALMTVFNARLGCWLRNPAAVGLGAWLRKNVWPRFQCLDPRRRFIWTPKGPRTGLLYLAAEMFGFTGSRGGYVYLSDGGHFENLGIYELVRRRCRFIIASDAGADPAYAFEDLGSMIRKCRTDFGVRIEIDVARLRPEGAHHECPWHCAIGLIRYDDVDRNAAPGILVYIKASLSGDEPSDVQNYASAHPTFPHETTLDQFFTESQFESYRALGQHIAQKVFSDALKRARLCDHRDNERHMVRNLFSALRQRWFPPPPELEKEFLDSVKAFVDVQTALRTDPALRGISDQLYPAFRKMHPAATGPDAFAGLHMTAQMLQVMENAWLGVRLEGYYAHPLNRGWMSVFRRWSSSDAFQEHWPLLRGEFSQDFVRFCEQQLALKTAPARGVLVDPTGRWAPVVRELFEKIAQEWPGIDRLRNFAAQLPDLAPRGFFRHEDFIRKLRAAVQWAPPAVRHILQAPADGIANGLHRLPARFDGAELARALERIKNELDEKWQASVKPLVALAHWLTNAPEDELLDVAQVRGAAEEFAGGFALAWPGHAALENALRHLPAEPRLVECLTLRKAVGTQWAGLQRSWDEQRRVWDAIIQKADRHKEHSVPLDALNDIRADLQKLRDCLTKEWLGADPDLGAIMAKLDPLLHDGKLPLSVRQVRQVLGGLESLLQSRLPRGLPDDFPRRFIRRLENSLYLQPLVWLVPLPRQTPAPSKWSEKLYACGLICLLPKSSHRSEVLFWVRGPYRNLGIGHECFEKPLRQICERLKILDQCDCLGNDGAKGSDDVKLLAVYPNGNLPGSAEKLERAMWLSFFFDYGFRRQQPADEQSPVDLILERGLNVESL